MNALDRAFIKAFAKDRPATSSERAETATVARQQPPAPGVASQMLPPGSLPGGPRHLRVDRPVCPEPVFLVPHLVMPLVQHRESYDVAALGVTPVESVWVEHRMFDADAAGASVPARENVESRGPRPRPAGRHTSCTDRHDQLSRESAALERWSLWVVPTGDCPVGRTCLYACPDLSATRADAAQRCTTVVQAGNVNVDPRTCTIPDAPAIAPASSGSDSAARDRARQDAEQPVEVPASSPTATATAPAPPFRPVWEVDAFVWPEVVLRLSDISHAQLSQTGEALATAVQDGLRVVVVTSAVGQEGRTTVALALARAAAAAGSRVALVDLDSQHPDLARQLGIESPCDWPEILSAGQSLSEAAVASVAEGVTLFPRVAPSQQLAAQLDARLLSTVLSDLQRCFDLVIVDAPEIENLVAETLLGGGAAAVDMAVLVRDAQRTTRDDCLAAAARLRPLGVRAVGIVENFATWDPTDA